MNRCQTLLDYYDLSKIQRDSRFQQIYSLLRHPLDQEGRRTLRRKLEFDYQEFRQPYELPEDAAIFATPVFIISYNRLNYMKQLIGWLERRGFEDINLIDNASTYPPLLEYLESCPHKVHRMDKNYGHLVLYKSGRFNEIIQRRPYILTDNDVLPPEDVPSDFLRRLFELLGSHPRCHKVGFDIRIDDLPPGPITDSIVAYNAKQAPRKLAYYDVDAHFQEIDTTFALYRPAKLDNFRCFGSAIRLGGLYAMRHLPAYEDPGCYDEEQAYYYGDKENVWSTMKDAREKLSRVHN